MTYRVVCFKLFLYDIEVWHVYIYEYIYEYNIIMYMSL